MAKNNTVDTAQKGQTTTKNNISTGKVKTLANATERRKAREEQFRNFRINALKRRCKRYGFDDAKTAEYIAKLEEQMKAPKEYNILIMLNAKDTAMMNESLAKEKIDYKYRGDTYFSLDGDQNILAKLREIAPPSAKIYPYAKKMESVIPKEEREVIKKPSNNTAEKKAAAKAARKSANIQRCKGRHKRKTLAERKKMRKATTVRLKGKKGSTGLKKASTNLKKAA